MIVVTTDFISGYELETISMVKGSYIQLMMKCCNIRSINI